MPRFTLALNLLIEERCHEVNLLCCCVGAGVLMKVLIVTGNFAISGSISRVFCHVFCCFSNLLIEERCQEVDLLCCCVSAVS